MSFTYAHMCQDEHQQIGHNDSSDQAAERCPLCQALDEIERLKEALMDATAHLAGAVNAYETFVGNGKRRGVRDALYNTRVRDFQKSLERARSALSYLHPSVTVGDPP